MLLCHTAGSTAHVASGCIRSAGLHFYFLTDWSDGSVVACAWITGVLSPCNMSGPDAACMLLKPVADLHRVVCSISHHFLAAYQKSLAQCCAAQFKGKGFPGGDQKVAVLLAQGALQVSPCAALSQSPHQPLAVRCVDMDMLAACLMPASAPGQPAAISSQVSEIICI